MIQWRHDETMETHLLDLLSSQQTHTSSYYTHPCVLSSALTGVPAHQGQCAGRSPSSPGRRGRGRWQWPRRESRCLGHRGLLEPGLVWSEHSSSWPSVKVSFSRTADTKVLPVGKDKGLWMGAIAIGSNENLKYVYLSVCIVFMFVYKYICT